jgi:fructosamine-3-kinase
MFKGLNIKPSILHGDLWSGNIATVDGKPSIFDPAVYYGHHEADFGMSWCAGFSPAFFEAYWSVIEKDEGGFEERKIMYQLYHILNHYNMFGGGYRSQAMGMLKQLL